MEDTKYSTKKIIIYLVICTFLILLVIGFSFNIFNKINKTTKKDIDTGTIYLQYVNDNNTYTLNNPVPISDDDAKKQDSNDSYFIFSVTCQVDSEASYDISVLKDKSSTIPDEYIHLYLEKESNGGFSKVFESKKYKSTKNSSMSLGTFKCEKDETNSYRLRMWLDSSYTGDVTNKFYKISLNVNNKSL